MKGLPSDLFSVLDTNIFRIRTNYKEKKDVVEMQKNIIITQDWKSELKITASDKKVEKLSSLLSMHR